jgi:hypothetical protein
MVRWSLWGGLGRLLGCSDGLGPGVCGFSSLGSGMFSAGVVLQGLGVSGQWSVFLIFFLSDGLLIGFVRLCCPGHQIFACVGCIISSM